VLGVNKDGEYLKAHAWVMCGDVLVTGRGYKRFTPVGFFADAPEST
jgi:hypothetical protein